MASTHFIDYDASIPIVADWLNDVNGAVYDTLPTVLTNIENLQGSVDDLESSVQQLEGIPANTQAGAYIVGSDTGSANSYSVTLSPAPASLTPGMLVTVQNIKEENSGASTLNVNGFGELPLKYPGGADLNSGSIKVGASFSAVLNSDSTSWIFTQITSSAFMGQISYGIAASENYILFPNGFLILQATAVLTLNETGYGSVVYPIAFSVPPLTVACAGDVTGSPPTVPIVLFPESSGTGFSFFQGPANASCRVNYIAAGIKAS